MTTYNYPNMPRVESETWLRREPLKAVGGEKARTVVILSSTVTANAVSGRRLVPAGTVLNKITSGHGLNYYGPYSKDASDGRETLTAGQSVIATTGLEVTQGNKEAAGYYAFAVLDLTYIQDAAAAGDGISKHGASLTSLKTAYPNCEFRSE